MIEFITKSPLFKHTRTSRSLIYTKLRSYYKNFSGFFFILISGFSLRTFANVPSQFPKYLRYKKKLDTIRVLKLIRDIYIYPKENLFLLPGDGLNIYTRICVRDTQWEGDMGARDI